MALTKQQLDLRRNLVTCSRLPMILGLSEWGHPIDVYNQMVFDTKITSNVSQRAGNRHERALLEEFAEQHDCVLAIPENGVYNSLLNEFKLIRVGDNATMIYPKQAAISEDAEDYFFGGTPDAIIQRDSTFLKELFNLNQSAVGAVVQAKLVDPSKAHRWGESQFGEPPQDVLAQVYGEIILAREVLKTKINFGFVVALIGPPTRGDYRYYCVHVDDETKGLLLDKAKEFWYIVQNREAEKLGPEGDWKPYFQAKWPVENVEKVIDEDGSATAIWRELVSVKRQARDFDVTITGLENALKMKTGDASLLYSNDPNAGRNGLLLSWRKAKDGKEIDWEAVARQLVCGRNGKVSAAGKKKIDDAVAMHTTIKTGARRFLLKGAGTKEDE